MARIFFTLYAGIIAAVLLFWNSVIYLYGERDMIESQRILQGYTALSGMIYELEGREAWLNALKTAADINLMIIEPVDPAQYLNTQELAQLKQQGGFFRPQEGFPWNEYFLYEQAPNEVVWVRYDSDKEYWRQSEEVFQIVKYGFFCIIAIALALWIWTFHRKLSRLEQTAEQLSRGELSGRAPTGFFKEVGGLNKAFNHMAERLEQLVSSHKRLTNAVAHELRTPIFRLRCQLELLLPDMSQQELDEFIRSMDEDLVELDTLVDELLSYARMESGRENFSPAQTPLDAWLNQQQDLARGCQHSVSFDPGVQACCSGQGDVGKGVNAEFDPNLIRRALSNLIRNADVYAETEIVVGYEVRGKSVLIYVDDDGPGIPEQDRERILQPFERLDVSRTRSSGGYGLGLSICREIASLHQGRILISDSILGGARIALELPLVASGAKL
ncbi:ATP-binding protein [Oceanospirillum beijerinckii]|uniref:ATP-binding protein n=1 Tax=Oceanospirillum beijerinckii TaxID=64976 RepID=UPI0003F7647E|nr:ATP-binding protein [Oceanospirillum beijerinckii]